MRLKLASAFSAASALVALLSLTNSTLPIRATSSIRCARPGNAREAAAGSPPRTGRGPRAAAMAAAAFWALCTPRSEPMPARSAIALRRGVVDLEDLRPDRHSSRRRPGGSTEMRSSGLPLFGDVGGDIAALQSSSTPDHRRLGARDEARLDGGIALHAAMPVEMVLGDVEEDADCRIEARREVDLERGALDHIDAAVR